MPLLAPVADKLGIDLIWFGVLLSVNLQTSFMHPPFGFALFYLRSVAAREPYRDRITGQRIEPITTGQIYWGAVPFVLIQLVMVGLTIAFPRMVTHYKDTGPHVNPSDIRIQLPPIGGPSTAPGMPNFGSPPPGLGGAPSQPAQPPATDLNQPPKFN